MNNGIGKTEHDADGIKVPLNFLQHDKAPAENIAQNNLNDNHDDQYGSRPGNQLTDPIDKGVKGSAKLRCFIGLCIHIDLLLSTAIAPALQKY
jgi:hypothetical protein